MSKVDEIIDIVRDYIAEGCWAEWVDNAMPRIRAILGEPEKDDICIEFKRGLNGMNVPGIKSEKDKHHLFFIGDKPLAKYSTEDLELIDKLIAQANRCKDAPEPPSELGENESDRELSNRLWGFCLRYSQWYAKRGMVDKR